MPISGVGAIIALVLLVWLASGFYTVDAAYRGVVLRFSRYQEQTLPGAHWHLPYPIRETVGGKLTLSSDGKRFEVGYRTTGTVATKVPKESMMLTDDENIVDLEFAVHNLNDPKKYLF